MSSVASITPASSQNASSDATVSAGLPPVGLAQAASVNTMNAALIVSGLGVDASTVAGVYGGAGAGGTNWFSDVELLPALRNLSRSTAEQALALFGVQPPAVGLNGDASAGRTVAAPPTAPGAAMDPSSNTAIPPSATLGAAVVDPLWGKNA